jgi:hypothetical protein
VTNPTSTYAGTQTAPSTINTGQHQQQCSKCKPYKQLQPHDGKPISAPAAQAQKDTAKEAKMPPDASAM